VVIRLRIEIDGRVELNRVLTGIADDLEDWRPALGEMADDWYRSQGAVFTAAGAHEGLPGWEPLSDRYAVWKRINYPGRPMLVLSGRLRAAVTQRGGRGAIERIRERELIIGANVPVGSFNLALIHHRGTRRGLPARPLMRISQPQRRRFVGILHGYLFGQQMHDRVSRELRHSFNLRLTRPSA
jgi:hypothetical protein